MGGIGGSGGGSSNAPGYLQRIHEDWLAAQEEGRPWDQIDQTIVQTMNDALSPASNPFLAVSAYNPAQSLQHMKDILDTYRADVVDSLEVVVPSDADIEREVAAFSAQQRTNLDTQVIPAYTARMRDTGSVFTSFYAVGLAHIEASAAQTLDKFLADLMLDRAQKNAAWRQDCHRALVQYGFERERMTIAANVDYQNQLATIAEGEAKWPLTVYQYGGNLLAAVSGGVAVPSKSTGGWQSSIGGLMQGMSMGSQFGSMFKQEGGGNYSGYGSIIGGIIGLIAAFI